MGPCPQVGFLWCGLLQFHASSSQTANLSPDDSEHRFELNGIQMFNNPVTLGREQKN